MIMTLRDLPKQHQYCACVEVCYYYRDDLVTSYFGEKKERARSRCMQEKLVEASQDENYGAEKRTGIICHVQMVFCATKPIYLNRQMMQKSIYMGKYFTHLSR